MYKDSRNVQVSDRIQSEAGVPYECSVKAGDK